MLELDEANTLRTPDIEALKEVVTSILKPQLVIAEIGSWKGHSASLIAGLIKEQGGQLYCIDHWLGDGHSQFDKEAKERDIFAIFKSNMVELELWDIIHPMYMDSVSASVIFADNILDMVFIDAEHSYKSVKEDIIVWYPKVKMGGIVCGHDWGDPIQRGGHRGVTEAIEELLEKDYKVKGASVWAHVKNKEAVCLQ